MSEEKRRRMGRPKSRPKMCLHKATGQARVTVDGKDHYLGLHGTIEAHEGYVAIVRAWEAGELKSVALPTPCATLTVAELSLRYVEWIKATGRYTKRGKPTRQFGTIKSALREFDEFAGNTRAATVNKILVVRFRDQLLQRTGERKRSTRDANGKVHKWTERELTRSGINRKVGLLVQMFEWAEERGFVPEAVLGSLKTLRNLRKTDVSGAVRETGKRQPVSIEDFEATVGAASSMIAAIMKLQVMTGMRPGEVCGMRWSDIDTTEVEVDGVKHWTYSVRPERDKTSHHEIDPPSYPLNPTAQAIVLDYLTTGPDEYLFSPARLMVARRHELRSKRKSKMTPSQMERDRKRSREFADHFSSEMYRQAVERACKEASVPRFTPYQLRTTFGTRWGNDARFGLIGVGVALNHNSTDSTEHYVRPDRMHAYRIASAAERGGK